MDIARRALIGAACLLPFSASIADGYRAFTDAPRVTTTRLTPGRQPPIALPRRPGVPPLYVIGTDAASRAWLRKHRAALIERGAIGFLIGRTDTARLGELRALAGSARLFPLRGDGFLDDLGIAHVPVLIDLAAGRIVQ